MQPSIKFLEINLSKYTMLLLSWLGLDVFFSDQKHYALPLSRHSCKILEKG